MIWRKITLKLKWGWRDLVKSKASFNELAGEVRVLCFHGICRDDQAYINGRFLKEGRFKSLIEELKETCNVISYQDYEKGVLDQKKLNLLITFDDAYLNNKTILLPHLETLKIPVLLFATCNQKGFWMDLLDLIMTKPTLMKKLVDVFPSAEKKTNAELKTWVMKKIVAEQDKFRDFCKVIAVNELETNSVFWKLMNESELREMAESEYITLGNHSATHASFPSLVTKEMTKEINTCASYLSSINAESVSAFAYPFGHYDETTIKTLKNAGIGHQFIADGSMNAPEGTIDRLVINPFISQRNQLFAIRDGKY
jgi:peptidoglycan/xylan/chitin deacetylase (PgdA/CDA1 family)